MSCLNTKKLCDDIDCKICYNKSFASIDYSINLKDKNTNPRYITKYSNKKYEFNCQNCNHIFIGIISKITIGHNCQYCCIPSQKLCNDDNCKSCFNNSFASSDKVNLWDYEKNILKPRDIFKKTNKNCTFKCNH